MSRDRLPCLGALVASFVVSACGGEVPAAPSRREPLAAHVGAHDGADAGANERIAPDPRARYEEREGEIVARAGNHAVVARATETRVDGPNGSLLALGATRATRGTSVIGVAGRPTRDVAGRLVRAVGANASEHLVTSPVGSEQSWRFASRPAGEGALAITIPVASGRFVGSDARGLRFAGEGGEVLYSHATFVDADDMRTPVPCAFVDGAIVIRVDAGTLEAARFPAVLDPTITPLSTVVGPAGSAYPAYGDQRGSAFASLDDSNGVVVYLDLAEAGTITLAAQRVDGAGAPVGARTLLASGVTDAAPAIACDAVNCLVAYAAGGTLYGVRVDASGAALDAVPVALATVGSLVSLAVADDGAGRLVAWSDRGTPAGATFTLRARRLAADGSLVGAAPLTLGSVLGSARVDAASFAGTTVVVWDERYSTLGRIQGVRIDAAGTLLDASPVTLVDSGSDAEALPTLAARSGDLVMAYHAGSAIWAAPLVVAPALSAGTAVSLVPSVFYLPLEIDVSGSGATAELAYVESRSFSYSYTVKSGTIPAALGPTTMQTSFGGVYAHASLDVVRMAPGPVVVASMIRRDSAKTNTTGYDVQSVPGVGLGTNLSVGAASARSPSASFGASQFMVAHVVDEAWGGRIVAAMRTTTTGTRLDDPSVVISTGTSAALNTIAYDPVVASNLGSLHALIWRRQNNSSDSTSQSGANEMVTLDGNAVPSVGVKRTLSSTYSPFAALGGSSIVFPSYSGGVNLTTITTTTLTSSGTISTPTLTGLRGDTQRAVGWNATQLLVILPTSIPSIFPPPLLTSSTLDDGGLGIDYSSTATLIVRRSAPGGTATSIEGVLLNAGATSIVKSWVINAGAGLVGSPRVAFDGTNFDVVYVRGAALHLVRVTPSGAVDAAPFVLATGLGAGHLLRVAAASDRLGRVLVAYEWYDATEGVRAMRIATVLVDWTGAPTGAANGTSCSSVLECASGICVDGVCCNTTCGGGVSGDCQACSATANGTLADGTCGPANATVVCRASAGVCDQADTCSGSSTTCPADTKVAAGTVCGAASTQPCETAQLCDGMNNACQPKAPAQDGAECRPATGPCDVAEVCTGASTVCPADGFAGTGLVCRPAAGACDQSDYCSGSSKVCPADAFTSASATCRPSVSICDAPERCTGAQVDCPPDLPASTNVVCRAASRACDAAESCDGNSFACPPDVAAFAGKLCRPSVGICDADEACDGTALDCPADVVAGPTTICRAATGVCDVDEYCTGVGTACPNIDARRPAGTVCRAANGVCDVAEACDGTASSCPVDALRPKGAVCRPADGLCDTAESCSGAGRGCPNDRARVDGSSCGDGLVCNGDEWCQAGECVEGEPLVCAEDSPCLETQGACAVRSRPGGAAGCSVAVVGAPVDAPFVLGACALLLLGLVRRARIARATFTRLVAFALPLLAVVAEGCVCGVGAASCDGACVDVGYDERNCGACGVSCGTGQCVEGACVGTPTTGNECEADTECIDANVCNGVERCVGGRCRDGSTLACDDGLACTADVCDAALGSCLSVPNSASCGQ